MRVAVLFILIAITTIAGCKKDKEGAPLAKLKTSVIPDLINGTVDTTTYFYNSNGTIASAEYSGGGRRLYVYNTNTIDEIIYAANGTISDTYTYFTGSDGLADSMVTATSFYHYRYTYDSKGFITREKFYGPANNLAGVVNYVNDGTNVNVQYRADSVGTIYATTNYSFNSTDRTNTLDNANMGMGFKGKMFTNPYTTLDYESGANNFVTTYSYTYDEAGRITARMSYNSSGALIATGTFSYY